MAVTIDYATSIINIPQADLTLIGGTLYELDTNWFRLQLKSLEGSSDGMPFLRTNRHNTQVTVAGTTFARTIEIINGYSVQFEDGQYTVKLTGSNNNIFDVQNNILVQNQVQVIPTNSAGLITAQPTGAIGAEVWDYILEPDGNYSAKDIMNIGFAALAGQIVISNGGTTITFMTPAGNFTRMVSTAAADGSRSNIVLTPAP